MTKKELIDEYDLDEDSIDVLDFLGDEEILILSKVKISPENSRFDSVMEVRVRGNKFTLTLNKSLESTKKPFTKELKAAPIGEIIDDYFTSDFNTNPDGYPIAYNIIVSL